MPFGGLLGSTFNFVFENADGEAAGRRPLLLPGAHRRPQLPHRAGEQLVRQADHGEHRRHAPAGRRVLDAGASSLEVDQTQAVQPASARRHATIRHGRAARACDAARCIRDNPRRPTGSPTRTTCSTPATTTSCSAAPSRRTTSSSPASATTRSTATAATTGSRAATATTSILGGAGDDIITDSGGDDNLQGGDGNDAIHGGNGLNLILGGFGNDFIVTGEDASEAFGGPGNDFILGSRANEMVFGNEGDDWIEHGMADGSAGENFDALRPRSRSIGNDVFIGDTVADRMNGEGGDDIMVGNGGQVDRYLGGSGFDWAGFKRRPLGVDRRPEPARLRRDAGAAVDRVGPRALRVDRRPVGLGRSADILRGDDVDAAAIAAVRAHGQRADQHRPDQRPAGLPRLRSLTADPGDLVRRRQHHPRRRRQRHHRGPRRRRPHRRRRLAERAHQRLRADDTNRTGTRSSRHDSMTELQADVFAGKINPGQLGIVREIMTSLTPDFDTAVFCRQHSQLRSSSTIWTAPTPCHRQCWTRR